MTVEYVEFPAMGLRVPVIRTLFRPFGQDIYTYAVIIALSVVLMILLGLRHADRYGIGQDFIIDFMIFALPASIICARLYYVAFSWDSYKNNLLSIINIRQGGIALYGSVIGAFLTVMIFSKVRKVEAIRFFDFGVPYLLLAQGIGRWGNFVNQEVFGANTSLPWGMTSNQIVAYLADNAQRLADMGIIVDPMKPVHPTFLYESLWNILVACVLFRLRKRRKYKGEVLLGYLIGYGAGRAFIEGLRTDSLMLGNFRISQLISVIIVVVCLIIVIFFHKKFQRYESVAAESATAAESDDDDSAIGAGAVSEDDEEAEDGGETGDDEDVEDEGDAGEDGDAGDAEDEDTAGDADDEDTADGDGGSDEPENDEVKDADDSEDDANIADDGESRSARTEDADDTDNSAWSNIEKRDKKKKE